MIAWQFLRFLVVGALNTLFGYAVFAGQVLAGVDPMPALVVTYVVGVLFNFYTTRRFVFAARGRFATLVKFVLAYVLIYFFNLGLYAVFERADLSPLVAQALCVPVVAVFSFLLFKFQVFRERSPGPTP